MAQRQVIARFQGVENCVRNLQEVERRVINKALKKGYMEAAELVREEAQMRAPYRTGLLSSNIVTEWDSRRRRALIGPHKKAFYGIFQERGTSHQAPQPFLRPALDIKAYEVHTAISNALKDCLRERL